MKQATPNIRTIDHADHTDIERLFYVYSPDGNGGVSKSTVWAVVWCGLKQEEQAMTGYNGLNSVKTSLAKAGICKHDGLRFTDPKCTHATAAQIAYTKKLDADYDFMQDHKDQAWLCNAIVQDVQPRLDFVFEILDGVETDTLNEHRVIVSRMDNGVDAVDAQRWQDEGSKTINLNGYKATATASWRERHLNENICKHCGKVSVSSSTCTNCGVLDM